jgi:hypothetical protein
LGIIIGVLIIAAGQLITCFVSIEKNSKDTAKLLQNLLNKIDEETKYENQPK